MLEQLVDGLRSLGYDITSTQLQMFELYRSELLRWNEYSNLTAITDPDQIETRHFLDSITPLQLLDALNSSDYRLTILDVGSGAGFPGIPLKLILPHSRLVMLEATGKKVAFLVHLVDLLHLDDTEVVQERAEVLAHSASHREHYSLVVARAVAPLRTLAEICLPFTSLGGLFVAFKKGDMTQELFEARNAVSRLGGGESRITEVRLPQLPDQRCLVSITKAYPSPNRYPRRIGIPFKRPL